MQRFARGILLSASLCLLAGCGKRETPVELGNQNQMLLLGNGAEPEDLDPHVVTGLPEHYILTALLEGLVTEHPETIEIEPGMAERWERSEDGTAYTFHLRDAKWSNGDPVVASDFVFSVQRILNPALGAPNAYMLFILKNAEAYHKGEVSFDEVGVKAVDDKTLVYTLRAASPYFLPRLTHYSWYPVNPKAIHTFDAVTKRGSGWTKPENYVGNGPFVLSEWRVNDRIVVTKNPQYYAASDVKLNGITFLPIDDENTEERAFRTGQLHVTGTVPYNKIPEYRESGSKELMIHDYVSTYYYQFNTTRPPLDDPRVRRALTYAIDRKAITEHITRAGEQPALHFVPPKMADYGYAAKMNPSLEEAKRLIDEVKAEKYPNGDFPVMQLLYNKSELHLNIAEAVQQMWKNTLGIEVELVNQEWKVYLETRRKLEFDICRAGWVGDYADPNTFLDLFLTGSGNSNTGWSNAEYDSLIQQAADTPSATKRMDLLQQAEGVLLQDLPIAPVYFYVSKSLIRPEVKGWYPNILDHHPYPALYLAP